MKEVMSSVWLHGLDSSYLREQVIQSNYISVSLSDRLAGPSLLHVVTFSWQHLFMATINSTSLSYNILKMKQLDIFHGQNKL